MWGINVGRAIRRKNEEVFLVPPPQAYGFRGRYRTSSLALLRGMGRLSSRPPMAVVPFLLSGARRDFSAGEDDEYDLDPGVDFKYGLTPSLTLDLSWKTDFAQVESDQEQVNLTRFSLFFPEKRDFFLEGAGIFEFGERVEMQGLGGRPPTLLFYSRRIGIEEGHNVPVVAGGKLTGRAGPYQIGALRMTTRAGTFVDEEEDTLSSRDVSGELALEHGAFDTHLFGHRFLYSFSPDMFVRGFLQWNSAGELAGGNFLYNYRYRPGSDLFVVYNQVWDTEGGLRQASRSLQLKLSWFWKR